MTSSKEKALEYLYSTDLSYYIPMNTCKRCWKFIERAIGVAITEKDKEIEEIKNNENKFAQSLIEERDKLLFENIGLKQKLKSK